MQPQVLAIIPARGGSKGFPGKNKSLLQGAPLLAWSIAAGLEAKGVDKVIVSTDNAELASLGTAWGAQVPFLRPPEISDDAATDVAFLKHALLFFDQHLNWRPEYVVLLRPTSPIRPQGIVDNCLERLMAHPEADSLRVVTEAPQTPYKMWWNQGDFLSPILQAPSGIPQPFNAPRQSLPKVFWQIGTLDIIRSSVILENHSASGNKILGHYLPPDYAIDIDSERDLDIASNRLQFLPDCIKPQKL